MKIMLVKDKSLTIGEPMLPEAHRYSFFEPDDLLDAPEESMQPFGSRFVEVWLGHRIGCLGV
jgi:hypothetical protein